MDDRWVKVDVIEKDNYYEINDVLILEKSNANALMTNKNNVDLSMLEKNVCFFNRCT